MTKKALCIPMLLALLTGCVLGIGAQEEATPDPAAHFSWFEYSGNDEVFKKPLGDDKYRNPILAGFHPDPSVVRVGEDYYMVNSTFGFFPGIPVFHSRDLVNWTQSGNAIHRPSQLPYDGIHLGQQGVYAPAIEYRDGTFYVINTCVGCGGNFVVTATNPAGPWSDPIWTRSIEGIDPSIFFDDDGKTYVVHHRNPEPRLHDAHTGLWVIEVDPKTFEPISEDVMLVDGGDETPWNTDWIEGPHIYKVGGTYYLSAAGGGTGHFHQQLLFKSDNIFGPYTANPNNPVLTQFGLPDGREYPVTATGHADMFQDNNGDWWAVFLGTRVYDLGKPPQNHGKFHTGRETFMLPVTWEKGWPVILEESSAVPSAVNKPSLPTAEPAERALTGNFKVREEFIEDELEPHWLFIRAPHSQWWSTGEGALILEARPDRIGGNGQPSFVGRRLAHMTASFGTEMRFTPRNKGDEAGLLAIQNDEHFYSFGLGQDQSGHPVLRIRKKAGEAYPSEGKIVSELKVDLRAEEPIWLRMSIDKTELDFAYSLDGKNYHFLIDNADSHALTTAMAGGFTGAVVGMYAETVID